MSTLSAITPPVPAPSSLPAKLLNLLVSPSLVFDEVAAGPVTPANWLVPTGLAALTSLLFLDTLTDADRTAALLQQGRAEGQITGPGAALLTDHWQLVSRVAICLGPFLGVLWTALVLWWIGRVFLHCRFPFRKALEVAGLSATILVLGTIVTAFLALAAGDALARPALSLVLFKLDPASRLRASAEVLNVFYLWTTAVLALGLSRLSGVGFKEAAFWVFGFWIVLRIALLLLA